MFHVIMLLAISIMPLGIALLYFHSFMYAKNTKMAILAAVFWGGLAIMMGVGAGREWATREIQREAGKLGYEIRFRALDPKLSKLVIKKIEEKSGEEE